MNQRLENNHVGQSVGRHLESICDSVLHMCERGHQMKYSFHLPAPQSSKMEKIGTVVKSKALDSLVRYLVLE